jgi:hypothetical protein
MSWKQLAAAGHPREACRNPVWGKLLHQCGPPGSQALDDRFPKSRESCAPREGAAVIQVTLNREGCPVTACSEDKHHDTM